MRKQASPASHNQRQSLQQAAQRTQLPWCGSSQQSRRRALLCCPASRGTVAGLLTQPLTRTSGVSTGGEVLTRVCPSTAVSKGICLDRLLASLSAFRKRYVDLTAVASDPQLLITSTFWSWGYGASSPVQADRGTRHRHCYETAGTARHRPRRLCSADVRCGCGSGRSLRQIFRSQT